MTKICDVSWRGQKSKFIVSNPKDLVQSCFERRHFFSIEELEDLLIYIKPNSIILDIGANVGNHTVFFAKHLHAKSVVPFEVNPTAVELLRKNIELNHLTNVDLSHVGVGLGSRKGDLYLNRSVKNNLAATSFSTTASSNISTTSLKVNALDNLISSDAQVDFIKIDVEGMEFDVLEGSYKLIQSSRPIVFMECWGWVASLRLLCWLVGNNYRIEKKYGPSYLVRPLAEKEHYLKDYSDALDWMKLRSFIERGDDFANEGMTRLLEKFPLNPHISYGFAEILLKLNQIEAVWKVMEDVVDKAGDQVVAWYQTIAEVSERCGDINSQLEALRMAAQLSPADIQIIAQLSDVYLTKGDEDNAYDLIVDFLEKNPESARGHYIRSVLAERRGQMAEALRHADSAANLDSPDKPSFMVRFADLTLSVGNSPIAALDFINQAIRLGQTSDWAYQVKIRILETLDKPFSSMLLSAYYESRILLRRSKGKLFQK